MNALTQQERLIGFIRLWTEIKYNFANFDLVPEVNWDAVLLEYLPRVQRDQTTEEYYRLLQQCAALLKDGHTRVIPSGGRVFGDAPAIGIAPIQGKAVVVEVCARDELKQAPVEVGMEITHVDGRTVAEVLSRDIYPYISASTAQARDRFAYRKILEGPKDAKVRVRVRALDGAAAEMTLTREPYGSALPDRDLIEYRALDDAIAYVALNSFGSDEVVSQFDGLLAKICEAKGLVIDVRANPGGSSANGDAILARLTDRPLPTERWRTRQYLPSFRAWSRSEAWYQAAPRMIEPHGDRQFLGPIVVLIGPDTGSAAEDFLIPLHAGRRATLVGERTSGSTGQPLLVDLPGGGSACICTLRCTYPDGREFIGVGVIPDVEVAPTQEDVAAGRDAVFEKSLEVLNAAMRA